MDTHTIDDELTESDIGFLDHIRKKQVDDKRLTPNETMRLASIVESRNLGIAPVVTPENSIAFAVYDVRDDADALPVAKPIVSVKQERLPRPYTPLHVLAESRKHRSLVNACGTQPVYAGAPR